MYGGRKRGGRREREKERRRRKNDERGTGTGTESKVIGLRTIERQGWNN